MHKCVPSGKSCNPGDLTFWEGTGRLLQFTVEGEEAVGVEGGGLVQLGGKHRGKQRRYATVHREVAGQDPPAVQTDVSSKATNQAVSRGFPYKNLEVGTSHRL